jgi:cobalt/nickel transport system permease protein
VSFVVFVVIRRGTLQVVHIPDGYLSPSTCAALYAGAAPFWWVALRRLKRALHTRLVPRISLFAAFSFVVMMFNVPLPGGTTGHATGVALAAIVLGPSGAILAVSTALVIQAFFFADGGITTLGANCFNIAILGSLVAYVVYRVVAGRAPVGAPRRVAAAGLAGYAAINVAALATAVEFGIQPLLFRDASGAPLYCPYPLSVAVPAMMAGHLTVAGVAELVLTGGVVAFIQRTDVSLLSAAAGPPNLKPLWLTLGLLLVLTPLGLLAGGTAWGEWAAPAGSGWLASVWTAPIPDYAPPFLRSRAVGYALSGMFGAGLVVLAVMAVGAATRLFRRVRTGRNTVAP